MGSEPKRSNELIGLSAHKRNSDIIASADKKQESDQRVLYWNVSWYHFFFRHFTTSDYSTFMKSGKVELL